MDFYDTSTNSTSVTTGIVLTDSQMNLTFANCQPSAPVGYQAVCNVGAIVADADGNGIDEVNDTNSQMVGVGDFLGNGRQQPLFNVTNSLRKGVLVNSTWQAAGVSFGISCSSAAYSGSGTCVLGDINGDGATDLFRYNGNNDSASIWLSTGVGLQELYGHLDIGPDCSPTRL